MASHTTNSIYTSVSRRNDLISIKGFEIQVSINITSELIIRFAKR